MVIIWGLLYLFWLWGILKAVIAFLFFSVVVLAVLLTPVRSGEDLTQTIVVEKIFFSELDFKNSVRQCFSIGNLTRSFSCLIDLEGFFEGEMSRAGISSDLWVGFVSSTDLEDLKQKMLLEGRALKCGNCFDFDVVFEGLSVLNAVLFFEERVVVSSTGIYLFSKAGNYFFHVFGNHPVIGASFYANGMAVVSTVGEEFK